MLTCVAVIAPALFVWNTNSASNGMGKNSVCVIAASGNLPPPEAAQNSCPSSTVNVSSTR